MMTDPNKVKRPTEAEYDEERAETTAGFIPAYRAMLAATPEPKSC